MNKFDKYVIWYPFKVQPKILGNPPKELKSAIPKTEFDLSYRYQFLLTQDFIKKKMLAQQTGGRPRAWRQLPTQKGGAHPVTA